VDVEVVEVDDVVEGGAVVAVVDVTGRTVVVERGTVVEGAVVGRVVVGGTVVVVGRAVVDVVATVVEVVDDDVDDVDALVGVVTSWATPGATAATRTRTRVVASSARPARSRGRDGRVTAAVQRRSRAPGWRS
jgi:hypothetical protein